MDLPPASAQKVQPSSGGSEGDDDIIIESDEDVAASLLSYGTLILKFHEVHCFVEYLHFYAV